MVIVCVSFVDSAPASRIRRSDALLGGAGGAREHVRMARQLQDPANLRRGRGDQELLAGRVRLLEGAEQQADAGEVHEADGAEIEQEPAPAGLPQSLELVPDRRDRGEIELSVHED